MAKRTTYLMSADEANRCAAIFIAAKQGGASDDEAEKAAGQQGVKNGIAEDH